MVSAPGRYFSWQELDATNAPLEVRNRLIRLTFVLDFLRFLTGEPIRITSGWRPPSVNAATPGASPTSKHMTGEAVDFMPPHGWTSEQVAALVVLLGELFPDAVVFDQVIAYAGPSRAQGGRGGHVHLGQWAGRAGGERREHRWAPNGSQSELLQPVRPEVKQWVRTWLNARVQGLQQGRNA